MVVNDIEARLSHIQAEVPVKHIILDCSCVNNIDSQGVTAFMQVD